MQYAVYFSVLLCEKWMWCISPDIIKHTEMLDLQTVLKYLPGLV